MTDDLENKQKKNNEIKQDKKVAKTTSDKPEAVAPSPPKTKELKKNTSNIDNKESKEAPQSGLENKKVV